MRNGNVKISKENEDIKSKLNERDNTSYLEQIRILEAKVLQQAKINISQRNQGEGDRAQGAASHERVRGRAPEL